MFLINICILYYFANVVPATVNYPTRKFNGPVSDLLMGLNGCLLIFFIAVVIDKLKYLKNVFIVLGKNTLGIVFFHF